jgi:hypothetical protein
VQDPCACLAGGIGLEKSVGRKRTHRDEGDKREEDEGRMKRIKRCLFMALSMRTQKLFSIPTIPFIPE